MVDFSSFIFFLSVYVDVIGFLYSLMLLEIISIVDVVVILLLVFLFYFCK